MCAFEVHQFSITGRDNLWTSNQVLNCGIKNIQATKVSYKNTPVHLPKPCKAASLLEFLHLG